MSDSTPTTGAPDVDPDADLGAIPGVTVVDTEAEVDQPGGPAAAWKRAGRAEPEASGPERLPGDAGAREFHAFMDRLSERLHVVEALQRAQAFMVDPVPVHENDLGITRRLDLVPIEAVGEPPREYRARVVGNKVVLDDPTPILTLSPLWREIAIVLSGPGSAGMARDAAVRAAVTSLQRALGLREDGVVSANTLLLVAGLYAGSTKA